MPSPEDIRRDIDKDTMRSSFYASLQAALLKGEKLVKEHQFDVAKTLLSAGITLIPSPHLRDHQFVVSEGVYQAAKKLAEENTREIR